MATERLTNYEKIKNMSKWELAEFIFAVSNSETRITVCERKCEECDFSASYCVSEIGEWLLEEVSDEQCNTNG